MAKRITYLSLGFDSFLNSGVSLSGPIQGAQYHGLEHSSPQQEMGADFAARIPDIDQARDLRHASDQSKIDGGDLYGGSVTSAKTKTALRGWSHDITFASTDANTVDWGEGTITLSDGTTYSITGGGTGNMEALTFIYLDVDVSTTELQTTTIIATSVGDGKILMGIAEHVGDANKYARYQVFGGKGGVGGTFVGVNNLLANIVTANEMNVTELSAITANLGDITAGTVTVDASGFVRGGQTAFITGTGFFLGYSTDAYKLSIGDADNYMSWDGSYLRIKGNLDLTSIFNNKTYTVANLPIPPTSEGFNSPSAID